MKRTTGTRSTPRTTIPAGLCAAIALTVVILAACSDGEGGIRTVSKSRVYDAARADFRWNATPEQRFGVRRPAPAGSPAGDLHWETPAGWRELPASSMRQANFQVAGDERAECYLTILAGDGGGVLANVNRWRKQMSLEPMSAEELEALPRGELFGEDAVLLDLEGDWTGMSGDAEGAGYRLVGLVQTSEGTARFLKMIGPSDVLAGELDAFRALAASFHGDGAGGHGGGGAGFHGEADEVAAAHGGSALRWEEPPGWQRGPARAMREVTLFAGADGSAECYVTILGGAGGGLAANVNRWREQMGAARLSDEEIGALARIPMLGGDGVLVEVDGRYRGMGDADVSDARLLGAVRLLPASSVFVKMIGPRAVIEEERDAFLAFCRSLEAAR